MTKSSDDFRILVVDDNRELREILEEYLRGEGDNVEGASNGKQALEKHSKNPYHLIITDLNMPEITGMEMIKTIQKENDATEFVIITGYASIDSAVEAIKLGAFDYIVKPFRMEELKVVVKNVREKVRLKRLNAQLYETLKSFYGEIERYRQKTIDAINDKENKEEPTESVLESVGDTEKIVQEIKNLERLRKGRLLID
ncbi:MAG TPA: response regulator [Syntrophorhabdaceae bacterium]|nr:response regulator [Syntrophorhabdaceae bacterium]